MVRRQLTLPLILEFFDRPLSNQPVHIAAQLSWNHDAQATTLTLFASVPSGKLDPWPGGHLPDLQY